MEAAAVTEEAATTAAAAGLALNETESAAAAAGCQFGGDPTWHATFTWWMDGIAMLMVGKYPSSQASVQTTVYEQDTRYFSSGTPLKYP